MEFVANEQFKLFTGCSSLVSTEEKADFCTFTKVVATTVSAIFVRLKVQRGFNFSVTVFDDISVSIKVSEKNGKRLET